MADEGGLESVRVGGCGNDVEALAADEVDCARCEILEVCAEPGGDI